jgi:hypothetical protein
MLYFENKKKRKGFSLIDNIKNRIFDYNVAHEPEDNIIDLSRWPAKSSVKLPNDKAKNYC